MAGRDDNAMAFAFNRRFEELCIAHTELRVAPKLDRHTGFERSCRVADALPEGIEESPYLFRKVHNEPVLAS